MKIGIITHHYVKNYGAYLQLYALMSKIKEFDNEIDIEVIDKIILKHYLVNIYRRLKLPKNKAEKKYYYEKIKQLKTLTKYENSIKKSGICLNNSFSKKYDKIIIGSDEVWNFLDYSYNPIKFGYGLKDCKVYTYAASAGESKITNTIPNEVKQGILNLEMIGVRDDNTKQIATSISNKKVVSVLDPTLIYRFDKEMKNIKFADKYGDYILLYGCKFDENQLNIIKEYAKNKKYKILGAGEHKDWYDDITVNLTPYEWVDLFRKAKLVITGTFHGLMFSIKYNKNFICMPVYDNRITKTRTILEELKIIDRLVIGQDYNKLLKKLEEDVNYVNVNALLNKRIEESEKYLREVLDN